MNSAHRPYVAHCGFCHQGLLRLAECNGCHSIVAICDECELIWTDVAVASRDVDAASSGAYPVCPQCGHNRSWRIPTLDQIARADLAQFVMGESS